MSDDLTLAARCGEWATPMFDDVFSDVDVSASAERFGKGYQHLGIAVLRDEASEPVVCQAARLLAQEAKRRGLTRFVQLDLPNVALSTARFTSPHGLSFRTCEVYSPPTVSGDGIAVPEMWVVRLDIAGMVGNAES